MLSGQVQAAFIAAGGASRHPGCIRALAIATRERSPSYPDLPTFAESGYPEVDMPRWAALMAPARTPSAIVQQLTRKISAIVMRPDVQAKMAELGLDTVGWDAPRTQAFLAQQLEATRKMVALGRIRI